ncbi:hypothetical protein MHU86_12272 [Fragilaria crotonensis]|nr:hypothetical protein MHU86_12272 [Fragilaria crotonensis]
MAQPVDTTPDETSFSLHLTNMLILHKLTPQDQQLLCLLRPYPSPCAPKFPQSHDRIPASRLNDHTLSPAIDKNTWPIRISISQKHARSKIPLRQGSEPFHQLHLDLMRNPFGLDSPLQQTIQPTSLLSQHLAS